MKVLVDTCIWSLALRRGSRAVLSLEERGLLASLTRTVQSDDAVIIGPIRQEILSGISQSARFEKIRDALAAFPDERLISGDFEEAARLSNLCRSRGVASGGVDILLCAVSQRRNWIILTSDKGLKRCIETLK